MRIFISVLTTIYAMVVLLFGGFLISNEFTRNLYARKMAVSSVDTDKVYIAGDIVGIYTECKGVFVIDTCSVENEEGELINPAGKTIKTGDYISAVNGKKVYTKEAVSQAVKESKGEKINLSIIRGEKEKEVTVSPVKGSNGTYMLGIWLKDDLAGVGTITYVTQNGSFGALGHGMTNGETGDLLQVGGGDIYTSDIIGIQKGKRGQAGEVKGVINYGRVHHMGEVSHNEESGIYGALDTEDLADYIEEGQLYEVARKHEADTGEAQIISEISGERRIYDIRITHVDYLSKNSYKGLHIEITDDELIALTGGIIQGMSGSPIIQDGKLIGAITHVLINDPKKGYGIFIEEMMK